ncbi:hypothetical protein WG66_000339 [Moniliophthora roreri]|nr:hypothetical protein WG66_000339 [Moniliophthora roreri]
MVLSGAPGRFPLTASLVTRRNPDTLTNDELRKRLSSVIYAIVIRISPRALSRLLGPFWGKKWPKGAPKRRESGRQGPWGNPDA